MYSIYKKKKNTYQEVKYALSEHFKCYAHMAMVLKPVQHFYT